MIAAGGALRPVDPTQPVERPEPEQPGAIFVHGRDHIAAEIGPTREIDLIQVETLFVAVVDTQASPDPPDPQQALPILVDRPPEVAAQAGRIVRIVPHSGLATRYGINSHETAAFDPQPVRARLVGVLRPDIVAVRVAGSGGWEQ